MLLLEIMSDPVRARCKPPSFLLGWRNRVDAERRAVAGCVTQPLAHQLVDGSFVAARRMTQDAQGRHYWAEIPGGIVVEIVWSRGSGAWVVSL